MPGKEFSKIYVVFVNVVEKMFLKKLNSENLKKKPWVLNQLIWSLNNLALCILRNVIKDSFFQNNNDIPMIIKKKQGGL